MSSAGDIKKIFQFSKLFLIAIISSLIIIILVNSLHTPPRWEWDFRAPCLKWRFLTSRAIYSSPAYAEGMVIFGSMEGYVYALSAISGSLVWRYPTRGPVEGNPFIYRGRIYVGDNRGYLYALDLKGGDLIWKAHISWDHIQSSPVVKGDVVYIGCDNHRLYAIDRRTGANLFHFTSGGPIEASPRVKGNRVYIGSHDKSLTSLNAVDGRVIWSLGLEGGIESTPWIEGNLLFVGDKEGYFYGIDIQIPPNPPLLKGGRRGFNPPLLKGERVRTKAFKPGIIWRYKTGGPIESSPVVVDGRVYFGSYDAEVYCLDAHSGRLIWRFLTNDSIESSPCWYRGNLIIGSHDGSLYVLDALTGSLKDKFTTGNDIDESSPLIISGICPASRREKVTIDDGGLLFIGSTDGALYCLDIKAAPCSKRAQVKALRLPR